MLKRFKEEQIVGILREADVGRVVKIVGERTRQFYDVSNCILRLGIEYCL